MGQKANKKRTAPNEARAYLKNVRTSPQKLNLLAQSIRGKNAGRAMIDLEFSRKRIAEDVRKLLQSAIANAENNHNLDVDRLIVAEASVGKGTVLKRFRARARGRAARIEKKFANMTIVVREPLEEAVAKPKKAEKPAEAKEAKKEQAKKPAAKKSQPKADKPAAKKEVKPQGDKE